MYKEREKIVVKLAPDCRYRDGATIKAMIADKLPEHVREYTRAGEEPPAAIVRRLTTHDQGEDLGYEFFEVWTKPEEGNEEGTLDVYAIMKEDHEAMITICNMDNWPICTVSGDVDILTGERLITIREIDCRFEYTVEGVAKTCWRLFQHYPILMADYDTFKPLYTVIQKFFMNIAYTPAKALISEELNDTAITLTNEFDPFAMLIAGLTPEQLAAHKLTPDRAARVNLYENLKRYL